jgi:hypothetical protein
VRKAVSRLRRFPELTLPGNLEDAEGWYNQQQAGPGNEFRGAISDLFGRLTGNPRIYAGPRERPGA